MLPDVHSFVRWFELELWAKNKKKPFSTHFYLTRNIAKLNVELSFIVIFAAVECVSVSVRLYATRPYIHFDVSCFDCYLNRRDTQFDGIIFSFI